MLHMNKGLLPSLASRWDCLRSPTQIQNLLFFDRCTPNPLMAQVNHSDWIGRLPAEFNYLLEGTDRTPEELQDDSLILYFRCKYGQREKLKQFFSEAERIRIELELERIDKLRSTFAQHVENGPLVQSMTVSKKFWRTHAKELCRTNSEKNEVKRLSREATTEETRQRYRDHLSLLQRVGEWTISADPVRPSTSLEEDKGYGFIAPRITLKKSQGSQGSGASSFGEYVLKSYPVHNILFDKNENPLMEECEEDTIQYFHFPANCMLWVEVCNSFYN
jgi:hypothetical protein